MEVPAWNKNKPYAIVTEDGSWLNYADYYSTRHGNPQIVFIEPFEAKLLIRGFSKGRSAANFRLKNVETGAQYTMFSQDFIEYVKDKDVIQGVLTGTWTVVKRGANYGIKHV